MMAPRAPVLLGGALVLCALSAAPALGQTLAVWGGSVPYARGVAVSPTTGAVYVRARPVPQLAHGAPWLLRLVCFRQASCRSFTGFANNVSILFLQASDYVGSIFMTNTSNATTSVMAVGGTAVFAPLAVDSAVSGRPQVPCNHWPAEACAYASAHHEA